MPNLEENEKNENEEEEEEEKEEKKENDTLGVEGEENVSDKYVKDLIFKELSKIQINK
jgi:hypothetical protein